MLHFVLDEKFVDLTVQNFDTDLESHSDFYTVVLQKGAFRNIRNSERVGSILRRELKAWMSQHITEYDVVILHTLYALPLSDILQIPKHIPIVWLSWGFDLYQNIPHPYINIPLYGPKTQVLVDELKRERDRMRSHRWLKSLVRPLFHLRCAHLHAKVIQRIDYCGTVLLEEFNLLKKHQSKFHGEQVFLNYASGKVVADTSSLGSDIMVGNSASFSSNHADVFDKLSSMFLGSRKVYVPLSYGDMDYQKKIVDLGRSLFGEQFCPLTEFMPLESYRNVVRSCSHAIYFHLRQQAMGNVRMSLVYGAKVFLSEKSVQYEYLKKCGYLIFSVERDLTEANLCTPLSPDEVQRNREVCGSKNINPHHQISVFVSRIREAIKKRV